MLSKFLIFTTTVNYFPNRIRKNLNLLACDQFSPSTISRQYAFKIYNIHKNNLKVVVNFVYLHSLVNSIPPSDKSMY